MKRSRGSCIVKPTNNSTLLRLLQYRYHQGALHDGSLTNNLSVLLSFFAILCFMWGRGSGETFSQSLTLPEMRLFSGSFLRSLCGRTSWYWRPCSSDFEPHCRDVDLPIPCPGLMLQLRISPSRSSQSRIETHVGKLKSQEVPLAPTRGPIAWCGGAEILPPPLV